MSFLINPNDHLKAFAYLNNIEQSVVDTYLLEREMSITYSKNWRGLVTNDPPNVYRVTTLDPQGSGSIFDALSYNGDETRHVVFDVAGTITLPERWWFKSRNIVVHGNTSPGGICLTGGTMAFVDCENLTFRDVMWCLDVAPNKKMAVSWNPVKVLSDEKTCRNVTFDHCAILGGDDENDFGPLNHQVLKTAVAADGVTVTNCIFGLGTRKWRKNHNFSLAVSYAKNVVIDGNLFAHNNRRNPQVYSPRSEQDQGGVISNNIVYNYGSMGVGVLFGTWDIVNNKFIHGRNSKPKSRGGRGFPPIKTTKSFEDENDMSSLYLDGNTLTKRNGKLLGEDWDLYSHEDTSQLYTRTGPSPAVYRSHDEVLTSAGTCFQHDIERLLKKQSKTDQGTWVMTMEDVGGVPEIPFKDEIYTGDIEGVI